MFSGWLGLFIMEVRPRGARNEPGKTSENLKEKCLFVTLPTNFIFIGIFTLFKIFNEHLHPIEDEKEQDQQKGTPETSIQCK